MEVVEAVLEPKINPSKGTGALESEFSDYARESGVKPLNQVLEALFETAETLVKAIKPWIET